MDLPPPFEVHDVTGRSNNETDAMLARIRTLLMHAVADVGGWLAAIDAKMAEMAKTHRRFKEIWSYVWVYHIIRRK